MTHLEKVHDAGVRLPAYVKVGWRTYRIIEYEQLDAQSAKEYGRCSILKGEIKVAVDHGPQRAAETLLHEILHVIYCERDIRKGVDEEDIVSPLSTGLATVWVDNPDLMAWIAAHLTVPQI